MKSVYDRNNQLAGTFDGEYIYNNSGNMELRIDEHEVYSAGKSANYIGAFDGENIFNSRGDVIYTIGE